MKDADYGVLLELFVDFFSIYVVETQVEETSFVVDGEVRAEDRDCLTKESIYSSKSLRRSCPSAEI